MTGYETYCLYNALKLHFSTDYDYMKYGGKTNTSVESFENRKDKYYFYKLSRRNNTEDMKEFMISNFLKDEKCWVGALLEGKAAEIHAERMSVIQALTYKFTSDCKRISDEGKVNDLLRTNGDYPKLLEMTLQKDINFETFCILDSLMHFTPNWCTRIQDTIRWPSFHKKAIKYLPFLDYDRCKMKQIALKELQ